MRELLYIISMFALLSGVCRDHIYSEESSNYLKQDEFHIYNMGRPEMSKYIAESLKGDNKISTDEYEFLLQQNKRMQKEEMYNVFGGE